jgi:hypothetical protein
MARARSNGNGKLDKLDEAMTSLVQAQALLVQNQAAAQAQIAEAQRRMAEYERERAEYERETVQRFARIEAILLDHSRTLHALPDAVREKIGFMPS